MLHLPHLQTLQTRWRDHFSLKSHVGKYIKQNVVSRTMKYDQFRRECNELHRGIRDHALTKDTTIAWAQGIKLRAGKYAPDVDAVVEDAWKRWREPTSFYNEVEHNGEIYERVAKEQTLSERIYNTQQRDHPTTEEVMTALRPQKLPSTSISTLTAGAMIGFTLGATFAYLLPPETRDLPSIIGTGLGTSLYGILIAFSKNR